jgi:ABC-type antimicrobial peptide transport system ATPase subunit
LKTSVLEPDPSQKANKPPLALSTADSPESLRVGCRFADRCPFVFERCVVEPGLLAAGPDHRARCWLVER